MFKRFRIANNNNHDEYIIPEYIINEINIQEGDKIEWTINEDDEINIRKVKKDNRSENNDNSN